MKQRCLRILVFSLLPMIPLAFAGQAAAQGPQDEKQAAPKLTPEQKKKKIDAVYKMRDETLARLYKEKPEARAEIAKAVGYGVFDASQVNIILFVGATGSGVLVDNKTKKETFMRMTRAGTGPGLGFKSYHQVLVFKSQGLFDQFRTLGADVGAGADATVKMGGKGPSLDGSMSFNPELAVYQFTDKGLLLQANWGGVAYTPDAELN